MDPRARSALDDAIRAAVGRDLDRLMVELDHQNRQIQALRAAVGLPLEPRQAQRREVVAALRRQGLSERGIAAVIGGTRNMVNRDLKLMGVPRPPQIVGLDSRVTRGPRPPANGQQPAAG